jgi:hypothetical protein
MRILIIQPPFTQLNAPYPAIHCLDRFLLRQGHAVTAQDHSIGLYRRMMTTSGVRRIFDDAQVALAGRKAPDPETGRQVARYISYRERYTAWAEPLIRFLSAGDPGLAFRISRVPDDLPMGMRAQRFLDERDGLVQPEEAASLSIHILDDLADFIAYALDPDFGTVRYAERIAGSRSDYRPVSESAESGYLMRAFYRPWLQELFDAIAPSAAPELLLLSVPFPGCLVGAIAAAREARKVFGSGLRIAMGGGYVSTELRYLKDGAIFDDVEDLCFDGGYGALTSLIEGMEATRARKPAPIPYHTARRAPDGAIEYCGFPPSEAKDEADSARFVAQDEVQSNRFLALEHEALRTNFPDYRSADMASYIRAPATENPMHRLWSDAPWLKYQMAYGCYWHRCAFCDTQLDYVRCYLPSDPKALIDAASKAAERSGFYGIHFTDEALPLPSLMEFARLNRERGNLFTYWGNVRFDKVWTPDRCALLAASGFVAASGGIEIATERGLAMTGKGFTFPDLVRSLVSFKRSGILVHGYLIYGFPEQTEQDLVDSAEAVRQLFAAGLLDSAFWHRFVLTRHSEMYAQWKAGKLPSLEPIDRPGNFASNDLDFKGSERWIPFDAALEGLLGAWMSGTELEIPVRPLRKGGTKPSMPSDRVENLVLAAESGAIDDIPARARVYWIAGIPAVAGRASGGATWIEWTDRGSPAKLSLPRDAAARLATAVTSLARNPDGQVLGEFLTGAGISKALDAAPGKSAAGSDRALFRALRENGLVVV